MYHRIGLGCLLLLAATTARADMLPTPDPGPYSGSSGGLHFSIQSVSFQMGPVLGPHYWKTGQVVVLDDCTDGRPNCTLARAENLIGMEVEAVDGQGFQLRKGMVQQILDAFANEKAGATVTLELYRRGSDGGTIKVSFARD